MTLSKAKGKSKDLLYCTLATKLWVPHPFAYFAKGWESTTPSGLTLLSQLCRFANHAKRVEYEFPRHARIEFLVTLGGVVQRYHRCVYYLRNR